MNGESYEKTYDKFEEKYIKFRICYEGFSSFVNKQFRCFKIGDVIILNGNLDKEDVKVYANLKVIGSEEEIKKTEENIKKNKFKLEERI